VDAHTWRNMNLDARYAWLHRNKQEPVPAPKQDPLSVASVMRNFNPILDETDDEERQRIVRRTRAGHALEKALAEEAVQAEHAQKQAITSTIEGTAIGGLLSRR
jgi:hypothetical protein